MPLLKVLGGAGSNLYSPRPIGPPPPNRRASAKLYRGDPEGPRNRSPGAGKPHEKWIAHNLISLSKGSDGVKSTTAFFMEFRVSPQRSARVSCQEDKGWKIRI